MAKKAYVPEDRSLADIDISAPRLFVLLWGPAKAGKTTLAATFPRPRFLDLDDGMLSLAIAVRKGRLSKEQADQIVYSTIMEGQDDARKERGNYGYIKRAGALDRATDKVDEWLEESDEWDTLVLDSATTFNRFCVIKSVESMGRLGWSKSKNEADKIGTLLTKIQDYGAAKNLFLQLIEWFKELDKNVVITAHEYAETTESGAVLGYYPSLIGSLRTEVQKYFDEVWFLERDGSTPILRTEPDRKHPAIGSRLDLPGEIKDPTYERIIQMVVGQ